MLFLPKGTSWKIKSKELEIMLTIGFTLYFLMLKIRSVDNVSWKINEKSFIIYKRCTQKINEITEAIQTRIPDKFLKT